MNRPYEVLGSVVEAAGVEAYDPDTMWREVTAASPGFATADAREFMRNVGAYWLPACAEAFGISKKLKDYIVVPVPIMPSDMPNRNLVGFPLEELTAWNVEHGRVVYNTWKGKPTFENHNNKDHTQARGVVFDTALNPLRGTPFYTVSCLLGFDRNKWPALCQEILSGSRNSYSMGAHAYAFTSSLSGRGMGECPFLPPLKVVNGQLSIPPFMVNDKNVLGYWQARHPVGFEVSSLSMLGAYPSTDEIKGGVVRLTSNGE